MTDAIRVETISKQSIDAERRKSDKYADEVLFISEASIECRIPAFDGISAHND
jgi:hypothetical protein